MDTVLFNVHDVVLILTIVACLMAIAMLWQSDEDRAQFNVFLILFFGASATIPVDTLINFGAAVRPFVIQNWPDIFFVFEYGSWIQAPLAYWLVRALLVRDAKFGRYDVLLVVPFAVVLAHQLVAYHSLPTNMKATIQSALNIVDESVTVFFVQLVREAFRLTIALLCFKLVWDYFSKQHVASWRQIPQQQRWLAVFAGGFVVYNTISLLIATMLVAHVKLGWQLPIAPVGLTQNYFHALLYLAVVVLYARSHLGIENIKPVTIKPQVQRNPQGVNPAYISDLDALMKEEKVYTRHDLTLDSLAEKMGISSRTLSSVINGYHGCNFFEFVNSYRIEEAKRLLRQQDKKNSTMLDIMYEVGFNSKATFNGFFKRTEGLTPSEFRKLHAQQTLN